MVCFEMFNDPVAWQKMQKEQEESNFARDIKEGKSVAYIRKHYNMPTWEPTEEQRQQMDVGLKDCIIDESSCLWDSVDHIIEDIRWKIGDESWNPNEEQLKLIADGRTREIYKMINRGASVNSIREELGNMFWEPDDNQRRLIFVAGLMRRGYSRIKAEEEYEKVQKHDSRQNAGSSSAGARKEVVHVVPRGSMVAIDGSNVIGLDNSLRTRILEAMVRALEQNGYKCCVFVDKSVFGWLKNAMGDEAGVEYLSNGEKQKKIIVAPGKTEADGQILQMAEFEKGVHIISNDAYGDYEDIHPWIAEGKRIHGVNLVMTSDCKTRVLIAGFNLDITV